MRFLAPDPAAIVNDPAWLAHRYEPENDQIHFVRATRATHRAATFLTDEFLPQDRIAVTPRAAALAALPAPASVNFIFHSAYCCSTLLARAFDIPGQAIGLKEPVILNDISGWRRRGAPPAAVAQRLGEALALLARPFADGEQVIIKPSNVVNALAPAMMAGAGQARALLLYAPLTHYLASIARKGMTGRLWVRDLFVKLQRDGVTDYGFAPDDILRQTDLQVAAIGWIGQHRLFGRMVERFGPDRVRTLDSERMLADPPVALAALARHFAMSLSAEVVAQVVAAEFTRNSKTGERFEGADRTAVHRDDMTVHGDEVAKVAEWAAAVARSVGQSLDLPASLI